MKTNKEIITEIIEDLESSIVLNWPSRGKVTKEKLIDCWSDYRKNDWKYLGYANSQSLSPQYKKLFINIHKESNIQWKTYILNKYNYQYCSTCTNLLNILDFNINSYRCKVCDNNKSHMYRNKNKEEIKKKCKLYYIKNKKRIEDYREKNKEDRIIKAVLYRQTEKAKLFSRINSAKRRAVKLSRTPSWSNLEKIKQIYKDCPNGYHVDHIIPLQGKLVSGLHVENNLQYLTAKENLSKSNKFEVN